jgi:drug/metabolite transporter (DMT)-like permease
MWFVYAVGAAAVWGFDYFLLERLYQQKLSPLFLPSLQMLCGALCVGLLCLLSGRTAESAAIIWADRQLALAALAAIAAFGAANLLIALAIREGSAIVAALVEITYPLFIILFSAILIGKTGLNLGTVLGAALVLAGISVIKLHH